MQTISFSAKNNEILARICYLKLLSLALNIKNKVELFFISSLRLFQSLIDKGEKYNDKVAIQRFLKPDPKLCGCRHVSSFFFNLGELIQTFLTI